MSDSVATALNRDKKHSNITAAWILRCAKKETYISTLSRLTINASLTVVKSVVVDSGNRTRVGRHRSAKHPKIARRLRRSMI
mmetsp:Transcript_47215/g.54691  ORF Transcript_47215/g.54691 Transcript_47215/m.54691 type:complete len:82 (+) Transcript_47215:610-855(+)